MCVETDMENPTDRRLRDLLPVYVAMICKKPVPTGRIAEGLMARGEI